MVSPGSPLPSDPSSAAAGGVEPGAADGSPLCHRLDRLIVCGALGLPLIFLVLNLYLLREGIRVRGDGIWYVSCADQLRQGQPVPERARSRWWYIHLIAISQASGLGLGGVVAVHLVLAVIAGFALFDLGRRLAGPRAGLLAAALLVANPDIVRWNVYILTDSLYISAVVLAAWFIFRAGERGWPWYLAAVLILFSVTLLRPNGWLLVLVAVCYWLCRSTLSWRARLTAVVLVVCGFVTGFALLLTSRPGLLSNSPKEMLRRGEVIWGYSEGRLPMPADSAPAPGTGGVLGAVGYSWRHPGACLHLATVRVFTELAHTRPFYSRLHNTLILLFLPPLYAFFLVGFLALWRQPLAWLLLALIVAHLLVQAASYADWDGRFLLYIFPLIGVLSSVGLVTTCRWLRGAGCVRATRTE
jgi:hypothetical protein